jgi:hypothetical protein
MMKSQTPLGEPGQRRIGAQVTIVAASSMNAPAPLDQVSEVPRFQWQRGLTLDQRQLCGARFIRLAVKIPRRARSRYTLVFSVFGEPLSVRHALKQLLTLQCAVKLVRFVP